MPISSLAVLDRQKTLWWEHVVYNFWWCRKHRPSHILPDIWTLHCAWIFTWCTRDDMGIHNLSASCADNNQRYGQIPRKDKRESYAQSSGSESMPPVCVLAYMAKQHNGSIRLCLGFEEHPKLRAVKKPWQDMWQIQHMTSRWIQRSNFVLWRPGHQVLGRRSKGDGQHQLNTGYNLTPRSQGIKNSHLRWPLNQRWW